jgi:hypothetical protein
MLRRLDELKQIATEQYIKTRDGLAAASQSRQDTILARSKQYAADLVAAEQSIVDSQKKTCR